MMKGFESIIRRGLVVSCQLEQSEPMHSPQHCALFAEAASLGGAVAVRAAGLDEIKEIRASVRIQIIGCIRSTFPDGSPLVTPTLDDVEALARLGVDVIALDATTRTRPGTSFDGPGFVEEVRRRYPSCYLLADVSSYEEGISAAAAGADAISTVQFGRTPQTFELAENIDAPFNLLHRLVNGLTVPIFAEGFIWSTSDAETAMSAGAYGVIVGGAITRPRVLTQLFSQAVGG